VVLGISFIYEKEYALLGETQKEGLELQVKAQTLLPAFDRVSNDEAKHMKELV